MSVETLVFLSFILARELHYQYTINKLLNKFMSRNYYDYKVTSDYESKPKQTTKAMVDDSMNEDLDALTGIY